MNKYANKSIMPTINITRKLIPEYIKKQLKDHVYRTPIDNYLKVLGHSVDSYRRKFSYIILYEMKLEKFIVKSIPLQKKKKQTIGKLFPTSLQNK